MRGLIAGGLRLDVAAMAVVVPDQDQLDGLREALRSCPRRPRGQVQLLVRQPEDELGSFVGSATKLFDRLLWRQVGDEPLSLEDRTSR